MAVGLPKKILVGVDGSAAALEAARYASVLASKLGARITFLAVVDRENVERLERLGIVKQATATALMEREARGFTEEATKVASEYEVECDQQVRTGDVVETIVDVAVRGGYDLLIIASRKKTSLERIAAGEHASRLVDFSPIPILVYKEI